MEQLEKLVAISFDELKKAAGVKPTTPAKPERTIRKSRKNAHVAASNRRRATSARSVKAQPRVATARRRTKAPTTPKQTTVQPTPTSSPQPASVASELAFAQAGD
jgi:hypothetical protein